MSNITRLLKAIKDVDENVDRTYKKADDVYDKLGLSRFPITAPQYLLDDMLDLPVVLNDLTEYQIWFVKQMDALVGLFPIKIERTDENGDKQMLKFENVAEAIAELTGLLAEIAFDADTSVNVGVHATAEAIGAKIAAQQAGSYLKAIADYLGFQGEAATLTIPISCTPGATGTDGKLQENELEAFLRPSIQKAIGFECKEKDDLHSIIKRVLFDCEIARTALYKPLKPAQIATNVNLTGDAIKADRTKDEQKAEAEWDAFKLRTEAQTGTGIDIDIDDKSTAPGGP